MAEIAEPHAPVAVSGWWRERRWLRRIAAWATPLALAGSCQLTHDASEGMIVLVGMCMPVVLALGWFLLTRPRPTPARAQVDGGTLRIHDADGSHAEERHFDSGLVVPQADGSAQLELSTRRGRTQWFLSLAAEQDARAMLASLGLDASHRRVLLRRANGWRVLGSMILGLFVGAIAGDLAAALGLVVRRLATGGAGSLGALFGFAMVGEVLGMLLFWRWYKLWEVHIGTDGVLIKTGFSSRFIPREQIQWVGLGPPAAKRSIEMRLRDGTRVDLRQDNLGVNNAELAALATRLQESLKLEGPGGSVEAGALARNGLRFSEWRARLEGLLTHDGGYRVAGVDRETLARVLADAAAGVEARLGAAIALATRKDDPGARTMIRAAAEGVADPRVRVALEAIAEDRTDEDTVQAALARHAPTPTAGPES